ncbi:hypothetical protein [Endomicrobium proavitum]|uniref:Uncharacterized protein n=1 Tax=Endomicrobium proavitum TaxID=1408281 RepID=A0A0G3WHS7_9BACT|nr:hypothetical protein [Endomicrobium proavitum]AKL98216.1 hypothetical protein Epro_0837 [Endomicrobium proavitum]
MIYKSYDILDKQIITSYIQSGDKDKITSALLSLFTNKIDKVLAIKYSNWAMEHSDLDIKKIGIIGMGHIARVYGLDNVNIFKKNIESIEQSKNMELIGILNDAKDDLSIFI